MGNAQPGKLTEVGRSPCEIMDCDRELLCQRNREECLAFRRYVSYGPNDEIPPTGFMDKIKPCKES